MRDALIAILLAIIGFLCVALTVLAVRYERRPTTTTTVLTDPAHSHLPEVTR